MIFLVHVIGAVGGAFAGLMLGPLVKFSVGGTPVDLRYGFMLLGILLGYALARFVSRPPNQVEIKE